MEPEYMKWLRENKPEWFTELEAERSWAAEWRDKRIEALEAECRRLRKGIAVAQAYSDMAYCEQHDDWRICGYIFGCGDKEHGVATLTPPEAQPCPACEGRGSTDDHDERDCDVCGGTGEKTPEAQGRELAGYWPGDDLRRAFVAGTKWWEFERTKGTMWSSDQDKAESEAEKRYPGGRAGRRATEPQGGAGEGKP